MRIRTIMTVIFLSAFALLSAQTTVTAPEAPFSFEPLQMHSFPAKDFVITRYGAKDGNVKANTLAFARAMAACHNAGGGRVVVPAGEWITGPIHFESGCNLYLSDGATVVFDDDPELYLTHRAALHSLTRPIITDSVAMLSDPPTCWCSRIYRM